MSAPITCDQCKSRPACHRIGIENLCPQCHGDDLKFSDLVDANGADPDAENDPSLTDESWSREELRNRVAELEYLLDTADGSARQQAQIINRLKSEKTYTARENLKGVARLLYSSIHEWSATGTRPFPWSLLDELNRAVEAYTE